MIHSSLRTALTVGFAVALFSLGIVGLAAYQSTSRLREDTALVDHSHLVLGAASRIRSDLRLAESSQRGFVLTGDSASYLPSYFAIRRVIDGRLNELASLVDDSPTQLGDVNRLRAGIEQRFQQMDARAATRRAYGLARASAEIEQNQPLVQATNEQINSSLRTLESTEQQRLRQRASTADETVRETRRVVLIGTLLAIGIVVAAVVLLAREIGERTAATRAAQEKERLLVQFIEALPMGVMVGGHRGEVVYANSAARDLLGVRTDPGSEYANLVEVFVEGTDQRYPQERWPIVRALRGESMSVSDMEIRNGDQVVPLEVTGAPIYDEEGNVKQAIIAFSDISERRAVEQMKDEFLSIVSHELRTPLTSIRGALGLLASGKLGEIDPKGRRMLDIAVSDTDRLVRLINDILDLERMESGRLSLEKARVDAAELTHFAVDGVRPLAERNNITVEVEADTVQLWADRDRVVQTLTNLLGNAMKFSPAGSTITVSATNRGHDVLFSVRDQGRGIPPEKLHFIFERFQQVDATDARMKGGAGLGLAISRNIVVQHGGRIWAESDGATGSTFHFTLPLHHENVVGDAMAPGRAPVVLLAEDDASVVEVLRGILVANGYDVVAVSDGRKAIERARALCPAVIVLDIMMPDLDGREALRAIRGARETARIPVLILSVLSKDDTPPLEAPITEWLSKPIDANEFLRAVDRALMQPFAHSVLLIEADAGTAEAVAEQLNRRGLQARCAGNSAGALSLLKAAPADFIVLDFMLPDATGFELVESIRGLHGMSDVPMIVYSGAEFDLSAQQRLKLGATEFLSKARDNPEEVAHRVTLMLHRANQKREDRADG